MATSDDEPMHLYEVFQNCFNKIANKQQVTEKAGYQSPYGGMDNGMYGVAATSCSAPNGHHQPDRRHHNHHHHHHHQHADVPPQWVWTDKKYLAKKAAAAARRSASATGGGPSTAPLLSQWEHQIISIMGDGFGEPQTSARVPAFIEHTTEEIATVPSTQFYQEEAIIQLNDSLTVPESQHAQPQPSQQPTQPRDTPITSTRQQRRCRRRSTSLRTDSSVRDRLFQFEERRIEIEERRNSELAGIRMAVVELCRLMQQLIEQMQPTQQ